MKKKIEISAIRIDVSANGSRRGLLLGLKGNLSVSLQSFSSSHIDAKIREDGGAKVWKFTRFYGDPVENLRRNSSKRLNSLKNGLTLPWVVMGDFNEIMFSFEKKGW